MAKFIVDGATLSPAAPKVIATSNDGQEWQTISKANLNVGSVPFQTIPDYNGTGQGGTPGQNYPYPTKTILTLTTLDGNIMKFELQDLLTGGCPLATYNNGTKLSLDTAVVTVASWL